MHFAGIFNALLLCYKIHADAFILNHNIGRGIFHLARDAKDGEEEELLIPQKNPEIDPNLKSKSGTRYGAVLAGLDEIYPPKELSQRNAISRTDGYWSFIEEGKEPPQHFTYGEFDFMFFAYLLDKAHTHYKNYNHKPDVNYDEDDWTGKTFLDIGSGTGRLVIGAAALHPTLLESRGLEILPGIHDVSLKKLGKCRVAPISDKSLSLVDEELTDEKYINVEDEKEEYLEPLCEEMNEMQQLLQGMTAEEWREILGDIELDDDIFDENFQSDENVNEASTIKDAVTVTPIDDVDELPEESEEETHSHNLERKKYHEISSDFILPPDVDMIRGIENENDYKRDIQFESFEEFADFTQEQWSKLFEENYGSHSTSQKYVHVRVDNQESNQTDYLHEQYILPCPYGESTTKELPLAPIRFTCGSFQSPYEYVGDADVIFVFSSCMTMDLMSDLSDCLGRCKAGTIIISTEFKLKNSGCINSLMDDPQMPSGEYKIETLEEVEGWNWITTKSTAYIQRVTKSVWDGIVRERPSLKPEELAYQIIRDMEGGNLTDTNKFLRQIRNNMVFNSIPDFIQTELDLISKCSTCAEDDMTMEKASLEDDDKLLNL